MKIFWNKIFFGSNENQGSNRYLKHLHWYLILIQFQKLYCNENTLCSSYEDYFFIRNKIEANEAIKQAEIESRRSNHFSSGAKWSCIVIFLQSTGFYHIPIYFFHILEFLLWVSRGSGGIFCILKYRCVCFCYF